MKVPFRAGAIVALASLVVACAAEHKAAEAPSAPARAGQAAPTAPSTESVGDARAQSLAPRPPPPAQAPQAAPRAAAPEPSTGTRTAALREAGSQIEASQRELDVAGGDCRNACRALGSMDRAAGQICRLAQSDDDARRCGDAKGRVYSARDKVKGTCGSCPDVSVDRNDPVPSR